jgi:glycerol uptake facilitator-like aquaporin
LVEASGGRLPWGRVPAYLGAQGLGGLAGTVMAHGMFDLPLLQASTHVRAGASQGFSEFVAAFGLLAVILGVSRSRPAAVPYTVAAYITAAYWFTASTSFANPAVTLARSFTDTFSGIRPADAPLFIAAQFAGAFAASALSRWYAPIPLTPGKSP